MRRMVLAIGAAAALTLSSVATVTAHPPDPCITLDRIDGAIPERIVVGPEGDLLEYFLLDIWVDDVEYCLAEQVPE